MKVKALEKGYFGELREKDAEFNVPDDTDLKDAWFVELKDEPAAKKSGKPKTDEDVI
jgi:hypothetical protein